MSLTCLNPNLTVVQYNGGAILGQHGISNIFKVNPTDPLPRPTGTRAGTTYDIVLEYKSPSHSKFTLTHAVIVSPNFNEVTAMLKAGVIWVHDDNSPFVSNTNDTGIDYSYTSAFNNFHNDLILPQNDGLPTKQEEETSPEITSTSPELSLSSEVNTSYPQPAGVFNFPEKSSTYVTTISQPLETSTCISGKYIHLKLSDTFDDHYNIDIGHIYFFGYQHDDQLPLSTFVPLLKPPSHYISPLQTTYHQWMLKNQYIHHISNHFPEVRVLSTVSAETVFSANVVLFLSTKPLHQYLEYINGEKSLDEINDEEDKTLVSAFLSFAASAHLYTKIYQKLLPQAASTTKSTKKKAATTTTAKAPTTILALKPLEFFVIDPSTPANLRSVVLGHVGEFSETTTAPLESDGITLSDNQVWSIVGTASVGASQKYNFSSHISFLTENPILELPAITSENTTNVDSNSAVSAPCVGIKITAFVKKLNELITTKQLVFNQKLTSDNEIVSLVPSWSDISDVFLKLLKEDTTIEFIEKQFYLLVQFYLRFALISTFYIKYYQQQETLYEKKTLKTEPLTHEQCSFFKKLLQQRVLSQQVIDNYAKANNQILVNHPVYNNATMLSNSTLTKHLHNQLSNKSLTSPYGMLVLPVDRTIDSHQEIMGSLLELSSILHNTQNSSLSPFDIACFDVFHNNVNDELFSYTNFLLSMRLFLVIPASENDVDAASSTVTEKTTETTEKAKPVNASSAKKQRFAAMSKKKPLSATSTTKKRSLPFPNQDLTSLFTDDNNDSPVIHKLIAIDLVFDSMIDSSMVELAQMSGEEVPPPTLLEIVNYILHVQTSVQSFYQLPKTWSLLPPAEDKSPSSRKWSTALAGVSKALDEISYVRMLHSTIIDGIFSRFTINRDPPQSYSAVSAIESSTEATPQSVEASETTHDDDGLPIDLLRFVPDSNEDKLVRAIRGFSRRATQLLERVPAPVGLCQIPAVLPPGSTIDQCLPTSIAEDWDAGATITVDDILPAESSGSKVNNSTQASRITLPSDAVLPQLITFSPTEVSDKYLTEKGDKTQNVNVLNKLQRIHTGVDNTINLLNDRVRPLLELRNNLEQVSLYLILFPQLCKDVIANNAKNDALRLTLTLLPQLLWHIGLVGQAEYFVKNETTKSFLNNLVTQTLQPSSTVGVQEVIIDTKNDNYIPPTFDFVNIFSPDAPIVRNSINTIIEKCGKAPANSKLSFKLNSYEAITQSTKLLIETVSINVEDSIHQQFKPLADQSYFVSITSQEQLQRCLEGYQVLDVSTVPKAKTSFSRTATTSSAASATRALLNKKVPDAKTRVIVVWLTHALDGTYQYIPSIVEKLTALTDKYSGQKAIDTYGTSQNIVLARVNVEAYPDVLELFEYEDISALPALIFVQDNAERVDLRSTAANPKEIASILHSDLVTMIDDVEIYQHPDAENAEEAENNQDENNNDDN